MSQPKAGFLVTLMLLWHFAQSQYEPETQTKDIAACDMRKYEDEKWKEGFVVFTSVDTLKGKIYLETDSLINKIYPLQNSVVFVSEKTCKVVYYPEDILSFSYMGIDHQNYAVYPSYISYVSLSNRFKHTGHEKKIFVHLLRAGKCEVYQYQTEQREYELSPIISSGVVGSHSFPMPSYRPAGSVTIYHDCIKKQSKELILIPQGNFVKKMRKYFSDCPEMVAEINSKRFNFDSWQAMVTFYNKFCK